MSVTPRPAATRIQVISRAAQLLTALEDEPRGLSLSELARKSGLPRSTVHRLTVALQNEEFLVAASPNGRVRIGPVLLRIATSARGDLQTEVRPHLEALAAKFGETVDLSVLEGEEMRFIDQVEGTHRLRAESAVGTTFPLHCTANGKAVLAAIPRQRAERLLPRRLTALTPNTITDHAAIWDELDTVRANGFASDREEHSDGICALAAVIPNPLGVLIAISVPIPSQRFEEVCGPISAALLETCVDAGRELGSRQDDRGA